MQVGRQPCLQMVVYSENMYKSFWRWEGERCATCSCTHGMHAQLLKELLSGHIRLETGGIVQYIWRGELAVQSVIGGER